MKAPLWSLIAGIFGTLCASQTHAALIAYDGFSYTNGATINGTNGGTGWTSAWTADASFVNYSSSTALTYSSGTVSVTGDNRTAIAGGAFSPLVDRTFAAQTGTVYFSFLFRYEATAGGTIDADDFVHFMLNNDNATANSGGIGKINSDARLGSRIGGSNGGTTTNSATNMIAGNTYFLVGKISASGASGANYDQMDLFINPTSGTEPGTTSATDVADAGFSSLSHFTIRTNAVDANDAFLFDELRVGTTFADVVPVIPEPSVGLLAIAGLGVAIARRRRN